MKKNIIVLFILAAVLCRTSTAQHTMKSILEEPQAEAYWMGLDFTNAAFIGFKNEIGNDFHLQKESDIRDRLFPAWNQLMLNEVKKYDIKGALKIKNYNEFFEPVEKVNASTDLTGKVEGDRISMTRDDVQEALKRYEYEGKDGVGIVILVENFDKKKRAGTLIVTFFDMSSKKLIYSYKTKHQPAGAGLRNYWASVVNKEIKALKSFKYKNLKMRFSN